VRHGRHGPGAIISDPFLPSPQCRLRDPSSPVHLGNEPRDETHAGGEGIDRSFAGSSPFPFVIVVMRSQHSVTIAQTVFLEPALRGH
jgi:hypothetical protein